MLWFPNEARYWALKLQMDTKLPPLMPDEDKNFRGSLVLDFRKWWRHVKTIHTLLLQLAIIELSHYYTCQLQSTGNHVVCLHTSKYDAFW